MSRLRTLAVTVGFEPTVGGYPTQLFESCTFGRSDTSPSSSLRHESGCREPAPLALRRGVADGRSAAPKASRIGSDVGTSTLLNIGILAALTAGVLVLTSDDDDDSDDGDDG